MRADEVIRKKYKKETEHRENVLDMHAGQQCPCAFDGLGVHVGGGMEIHLELEPGDGDVHGD